MVLSTPDEARAALESVTTTSVGTDRDRQVHGLATAAFGAAVGIFVALTKALPSDLSLAKALPSLYVVALIGLAGWQARAARSTPRHARAIGYAGLGGTLVFAFLGIAGLNILGHDVNPAPVWFFVAAIAIAAPMLVAGWLIARRPS